MNTVELINEFIREEEYSKLNRDLTKTWDSIWLGKKNNNYVKLRLFKTADKIKTISKLGIDFNAKRVLDVGCGDGSTLSFLKKRYDIKEGIGLDISEKTNNFQSGQSPPKQKNLRFYCKDHRNLDTVPANSFDIVLSWGVVEHFNEYLLALAEARRVLKEGGFLILIQPHLLSFGVLQEYWLKITGRWQFGGQKNFSLFHYKKIMGGLGFKDLKIMVKPPYRDMYITRILDKFVNYFVPVWGHYLYVLGKK